MHEPEWIGREIQSALDRGMVPFVVVVPVAPDFLRDGARADEAVADTARRAMIARVWAWQEENLNA